MKIEINPGNALQVMEGLTKELHDYQKKFSLIVWRALGILESQIVQNIRKNSGLKVRTGALMNSIGASKKVYEDGRGFIYGEIGAEGIPYAAIHEFGGIIKPKNAKALLIPSPYNRNPDGSPKVTAQELRQGLGTSFSRNGVIWLKQGKGSNVKLTPMFFFQKSVTIPARPYMRPALAAKKDEIMKNFGLFIQESFKIK